MSEAPEGLRPALPIERAVGLEWYVAESGGTGGRLRTSPADFRVTELEAVDHQPTDADPGAYPHLVVRVTLRDWDTNDFARQLSNRIGMSRERVSWAGTKDKRAHTTQLFSLQGVAPADVPTVDGADVEIVGRAGRPVLFGDLAGNEFEVVVRDAGDPDAAFAVREDLAAFAAAGGDPTADGELPGSGDEDPTTVAVPNWFGHQRFGSRRPVTHEVGLAVVRGDWAGAVRRYVGNPHEREPERTREARAYVDDTQDWAGALDRLPRSLDHERAICAALAGTDDPGPEDYRAALKRLPSNLQRLFVHAAQSYAFNRILGRRLARGLALNRPVAGDVVCFRDRDRDDPALPVAVPDTGRTQRVTEERVETARRHCERGRAFVTAPLVGTESELGEGVPGEIERAVLEDLNLSPGDFDLPGEFDSTGDRRALVVETDLSVRRAPLTLSFALPPGSYATSLLREVLQTDPRRL